MKQDKIIFSLVILAILLAITFATSIGYAAENDELLIINDMESFSFGQTDFNVVFSGEESYKGDGVVKAEITGPQTAVINIAKLKNVGDTATVIFTLENQSASLYADISTEILNTNTEYFKVISRLSDTKINPNNGKTKIEVDVKLIKLPIYEDEKTSISIKIISCPSN